MKPDAAPAKDSGRQPERTALSWSRTGFLALLIAALSIRVGSSELTAKHFFAALIFAVMAGAMWHRGNQRSGFTEDEPVVTHQGRTFHFAISAAVASGAMIQAALIFMRFLKQ